MENSPSISEQPLSNLTAADLEILITQIVKKVIKQETQQQQADLPVTQESYALLTRTQELLNTFGSWEDTRSTEEIVDDIYASRTVSE
ncbi:hypothetical protein [Calothrix sp. PCC 6303]|uniref:hypothetical protein n=1 Tax=Calothrix sp. PCC 6303 TaxID=1170562 RepID=UPI0002A05002|nr:hypothetical protein [Calothrix sp. PCC 6303]AFZ00260.1 hypothetical protein Cal6303_1199 [Calothrix sp. PCC 6303]